MIALLISLLLWLSAETQSGYLSYAPLERVVKVRGWAGTEDFDLLLATQDCDDLARQAFVWTGGKIYSAVIVDCSAEADRLEMIRRQLVADTNDHSLVSQWAVIELRPK